jgi:hypothetical protein
MAPLSPRRKWQAITVSTLILAPAFWAMLAGQVDTALDDPEGSPNAAASFAFGFALIPFVFVALAFMSEHPRAPIAVAKAMGMSLLVGVLTSTVAADAVTGLVAGMGAGGYYALRPEPGHGWKPRVIAVVVASAYTFVLVRAASDFVLISAPVFPLTALGLADHFVEWRREAAADRNDAVNAG